jgi:hypothetical protein
LGDSRARALKHKFWHQLGLKNTYNFAYGGATIYEIYDTFQIVKNSPQLKTLVISVPLRSFDPNHKKGLNRVPEAIHLSQNNLDYYSNWFVSRISARLLANKYGKQYEFLARLNGNIVGSARAGTLPGIKSVAYTEKENKENCMNCQLPQNISPSVHSIMIPRNNFHYSNSLGVWQSLWLPINSSRELTGVFRSQVSKNSKSDWRTFEFSEDLWKYFEEIAHWCSKNNVQLMFTIPATILEMQKTITDYGFGPLNHQLRMRLANLAPVLDFDFNSPLTRNVSLFTDAYHFDYRAAKGIIGEMAQFVSDDQKVIAKAIKRRGDITCPQSYAETKRVVTDQHIEVLEGISCRIWRKVDDK